MKTITDKRNEWFGKTGAVLCECHRGAKIQYRCYQDGCKESKNYCLDCQEENKHQHNHVKCFDAIELSDKKWSILCERYNNSGTTAIASYKKVEPLIKYFEAVSINVPLNRNAHQIPRCITADIQNLILMTEKITEIMS